MSHTIVQLWVLSKNNVSLTENKYYINTMYIHKNDKVQVCHSLYVDNFSTALYIYVSEFYIHYITFINISEGVHSLLLFSTGDKLQFYWKNQLYQNFSSYSQIYAILKVSNIYGKYWLQIMVSIFSTKNIKIIMEKNNNIETEIK